MEKLRHGNRQRQKRGMGTTKQRDRRDMGETAKQGGGERKKAYNGKKGRKVHLKTQHGRQEENGWEREQDGNSGEKIGKSRDRWTI